MLLPDGSYAWQGGRYFLVNSQWRYAGPLHQPAFVLPPVAAFTTPRRSVHRRAWWWHAAMAVGTCLWPPLAVRWARSTVATKSRHEGYR